MEQARGLAGNNIVTVLMRERGIPLQSASDRIGAHFASLMRTFVRAKAALPSFGDAALEKHIESIRAEISGKESTVDWLERRLVAAEELDEEDAELLGEARGEVLAGEVPGEVRVGAAQFPLSVLAAVVKCHLVLLGEVHPMQGSLPTTCQRLVYGERSLAKRVGPYRYTRTITRLISLEK